MKWNYFRHYFRTASVIGVMGLNILFYNNCSGFGPSSSPGAVDSGSGFGTNTGPSPSSFNITGVTAGDAQVQLTWSNSTNAAGYNVSYGTTAGSWPNMAATNTNSPYTVTGLVDGTTYYFIVTAVNSVSSVNASSEASGTPISASPVVPVPGPSSALFSSPYYKCSSNYYVSNSSSTTNSDNNPGTITEPWATLNHANSMNLGPGVCINVVATSTPYAGVSITNGGNYASSTGYLVYRCTTLDGCTIDDTTQSNNAAFGWTPTGASSMGGSYVIVDGFNIQTSSTNPYGQAIGVANGSNQNNIGYFSVHHIWVLNSLVHGYAQSGLQMNDGEYFFAIHNKIYDNSHSSGCPYGVQGSGVSYAALKTIPFSYTRTADDIRNPIFNAAMTDGTHLINNLVAYNNVYNNAVETCGTQSNPWDTDGNGIIMDSLANQGVTQGIDTPYGNYVTIAFNIVSNNGGGGIVATHSENLYVANNSCYNNYLDPYNSASGRGCIQLSGQSYGNTVAINNIAVAIPTVVAQCQYNVAPFTQWNNAINAQSGQTEDLFSNNLTSLVNPGCKSDTQMYGSDTYSCTSNKCNTSPQWVNVGSSSVGDENNLPVGYNFALQAGSPAIGAGVTESYLPSQAVDAGACAKALTTCP